MSLDCTDALAVLLGLGMGDKAYGLREASTSLKLYDSNKFRTVASVPPEGEPLSSVREESRRVLRM